MSDNAKEPLPAGPELDAAVARAMGKTDHWERIPPYSTALGEHTAEMLHWLSVGLVQVQIDGNYEASWHDAGRKDVRAYGKTLQLAIARLVVAVHEGEEKP